jgi:two-component system LytT family response regulator
MEKLLANLKLNNDDQRIALPDKNGLNFFEIRKIIRCQSDNSYTDFFILDESARKKGSIKMVVSKGFEHFEDFLIGKGLFYRVHNQHIVNVNHIKRYIKDNGGYLIMDDNSGEMIPVARARKEDFLNHLKSKGIIL